MSEEHAQAGLDDIAAQFKAIETQAQELLTKQRRDDLSAWVESSDGYKQLRKKYSGQCAVSKVLVQR